MHTLDPIDSIKLNFTCYETLVTYVITFNLNGIIIYSHITRYETYYIPDVNLERERINVMIRLASKVFSVSFASRPASN